VEKLDSVKLARKTPTTLSDTFCEATAAFGTISQAKGILDARERALILVALNSAVTHMNAAALRRHVREALDAGATGDEIAEVFQLVSVLGIHAVSLGLPALLDVLASAGEAYDLTLPLTPQQETLKQKFVEARGYWNSFWEQVLRVDPDLLDSYARFSSVPWEQGVLSGRLRELIYVAIDASTTHMFDEGTRQHMANALKHGATPQEIMAVLTLASTLGLQSVAFGMAILNEEEYGY